MARISLNKSGKSKIKAKWNRIDLSGLKHFKRSLQEIQTNSGLHSTKLKINEISDIAYDILSVSYSSTTYEVKKPVVDDGVANIYVVGNGIAFDEFGTGFYAKGSYKGNLPTITLEFESAGYPQTTSGWDYYYKWQGPDNKNPKKVYDGTKGWFTKKDGKPYFHIGNRASNRFYNAVVKIKKELKGK